MSNTNIPPELFVEAMLRHVPFDGWSEAAMHTTAEEMGLSASDVARLFPEGLVSVVTIGSDDVDTKMVAEFMSRFLDRLDDMPVHIKIKELLLIRFEILQPHKEAVRKMITFMAKPAQAELGSRLLYKTLDRVWRAAGDRSTDYNFYSKRATLAAVYGSTLLAFLDDDTPDMQKTRAFLGRRLQDVAKIPKATKPLRVAASMVGTVASRIFTRRRNNTGF
jgi:ubiquinone biosynthesis protein COQ9